MRVAPCARIRRVRSAWMILPSLQAFPRDPCSASSGLPSGRHRSKRCAQFGLNVPVGVSCWRREVRRSLTSRFAADFPILVAFQSSTAGTTERRHRRHCAATRPTLPLENVRPGPSSWEPIDRPSPYPRWRATASIARPCVTLREELVGALLRAGIAVTERLDRARYLLHGVCRQAGSEKRVTFRLLDAATGRYIWAFDQDAIAGSDFESDERLALRVSSALLPSIRGAEVDRVRDKSDIDLTTHDLIMKAWPLVTALDSDGHQRAIELLQRARSRDAANGLAIALEAWCHGQRAVYQFTDNTSSARESLGLASRATRCGGDGTMFSILGHALACARPAGRRRHDQEGPDHDGGSAWAWGRSAWLDVYAGRATTIERFKTRCSSRR